MKFAEITSVLNIPNVRFNSMLFGLAIAPAPTDARTLQQPDLLWMHEPRRFRHSE
jgi:hypothetical protein